METTIPLFKKLYKILLLSLCISGSGAMAQEPQSCEAALLSQLNEQKRLDARGCSVAEKLVLWLGILRKPEQFTAKELISFLEANHHWPHYEKLCKKTEEIISKNASSQEMLAWFTNHLPETPEGVIAYGKTLLAHQQKQKAAEIVGAAWESMSLSKSQEKEFLLHFSSLLKEKNFIARLEFLLWDENLEEAERLLMRVPSNAQKIAHVRIALLRNKSDASQKAQSLCSQLHRHAGLTYELAKWHRKRKEFREAQRLLTSAPIQSSHAQKWWKEQNYIARELIALRDYGGAYEIVQNHKLQPGVDEFAEAEWLAGWLALRFLDKPDRALQHFKTFRAHVKGAISKSRGDYWVGRAHERKGENDFAAKAYAKAARYKTTYYGQLGAAKIKQKPYPILATAPRVTKEDKKKFEQNELVKAAHILKNLGSDAKHELSKFLLQIAAQSKTKAEKELSVQLAQTLSPHDVVWVAKKAGYAEPILLKAAYPTYPIPQKGQKIPEAPLVMAVAYQESRFVPWAESEAGAMGLLQLIAATAATEAKRLGIAHKESKLFDPQHNLILGSSHLSDLLNDFLGSYILAFAAYNAGPTPVRRWLKEFGDPRNGKIDIIDWVELIPYYETRNYVMRVLENLTNYRSVFQIHPKKTLVDDLKR